MIISDSFKSYVAGTDGQHNIATKRTLIALDYTHRWVNHSDNFVDPETGAHTQTIEGVWETRAKQYIKIMRGIPRDMLPGYLDTYLWKSWFLPPRATVAQTFKGLVAGMARKYN